MRKSGFTLIELLVVIAIIGILSAVVLTSLTSSRDRANDANGVSTLGQLQLAMTQAQTNAGTYPALSAVDAQLNTEVTGNARYTVASSTQVESNEYCVSYSIISTTTAGANFFVVDQNGSRYNATGC